MHKLYHIASCNMECALYVQAKTYPANLWTHRWRLELDVFGVHSLLAVDSDACGVKIKASNNWHNSIGCGVFTGLPFGVREVMHTNTAR